MELRLKPFRSHKDQNCRNSTVVFDQKSKRILANQNFVVVLPCSRSMRFSLTS